LERSLLASAVAARAKGVGEEETERRPRLCGEGTGLETRVARSRCLQSSGEGEVEQERREGLCR
jgi:hypothetical protein